MILYYIHTVVTLTPVRRTLGDFISAMLSRDNRDALSKNISSPPLVNRFLILICSRPRNPMKASIFVLLTALCSSYCNAGSWFSQDEGCSKPCVQGDESIMSPKEHGTSKTPVQPHLRWGCDSKVADQICNFNRHYAEYSGYWQATSFLEEADVAAKEGATISFYDSNTGKPLFRAPVNRSWQDFLKETRSHGWPSFRDEEVVWKNVRVLPGGETVSVDGTHLGHNLPDDKGRRYCINLVSVAGNPGMSR